MVTVKLCACVYVLFTIHCQRLRYLFWRVLLARSNQRALFIKHPYTPFNVREVAVGPEAAFELCIHWIGSRWCSNSFLSCGMHIPRSSHACTFASLLDVMLPPDPLSQQQKSEQIPAMNATLCRVQSQNWTSSIFILSCLTLYYLPSSPAESLGGFSYKLTV